MSKPTTKPSWYPADPADLIEPSPSKKNTGWANEEKPAYQFFNWLFYIVSAWIDWFDQFVGSYYTIGTDGDYADINAAIAAGKTKFRLINDLTITTMQEISLDDVILDFNGFNINTITNSLSALLKLSGDRIRLKNCYISSNHASGSNTNILWVTGNDCSANEIKLYNGAAGTSTNALNVEGDDNSIKGIITQTAGTITNRISNTGTGNILIFKEFFNYFANGDFYTGGGAADTYTATPVAPRTGISALEDGMNIKLVVSATNTGASTINVNSLGAKDLVKRDGSALGVGDLQSGDIISIIYNQSNDEWRIFYIDYLPDIYVSPVIDMSSKIYKIYGAGDIDSVNYADAVFTKNGSDWYMEFNFSIEVTSAIWNDFSIGVEDVPYHSTNQRQQAISAFLLHTYAPELFSGNANHTFTGAGDLELFCAHTATSSAGTGRYSFTGKIKINGRPTNLI